MIRLIEFDPRDNREPASHDTDPDHKTVEESPRRRRKRERKVSDRIIWISFAAVLWGGLVYGGYWMAHQYITDTQAHINERIEEVKKENSRQMSQMVSELRNIQAELANIQEELAFADETINGSNQTKQALQERMAKLDQQLGELKRSLEKLEDAISEQ